MGRENALKGMREFIGHYRLNRDHPVLQDFVATMRQFAPDTAAYDAFVKQWFFEVVVPEYKLSDARREEAGDHWQVTVHVENAGTGVMPLEIAAAAGERFGDDGQASPDYHDAREKVTLAAGEAKDVTIRCSFQARPRAGRPRCAGSATAPQAGGRAFLTKGQAGREIRKVISPKRAVIHESIAIHPLRQTGRYCLQTFFGEQIREGSDGRGSGVQLPDVDCFNSIAGGVVEVKVVG